MNQVSKFFFNCSVKSDLISAGARSNGNLVGLHVSFDLIYCTWDFVFEFELIFTTQ